MTDGELLEQVEDALDWEPSIDVSDVDVTVVMPRTPASGRTARTMSP